MNDMFLFVLITATLLSAVWFDIRRQRIPNLITFPAIVIAVGYHALTGGVGSLLLSVGGLALGLGIFLIPYALGGMGAGDVKLMAAVGAVLGPHEAFVAMLFIAIIGGFYAGILLLLHRDIAKNLLGRAALVGNIILLTGTFGPIPGKKGAQKQPELRYGVAIALGTFGMLAWRYYQ